MNAGEIYYGATAASRVDETVLNIPSSDVPTFVSAVTAATDTSAAIRPYSIAVAPESSLAKSLIKLYILITLGLNYRRFGQYVSAIKKKLMSIINNIIKY